MPKISVIIPVYNAEKYIEDCILSVLNQTEKDIEVIAVDDGSTDGSNIILQRLRENDKRLLVFNEKNQGQPTARNIGLNNAKGEFVLFVDADDTIEPMMAEIMYNEAVEKNADVVVCSYNNIHTYKNRTYVRRVDDNVNGLTFGDFFIELHQQQLIHPVWNKMYRMKIFDNIRYKNYVPGQDAILNLEIAQAGNYCFCYIDKPLYNFYSRSKGSVTNSYKAKIKDSLDVMYEMWEELLRNKKTTANKKDFLDNMFFVGKISVLKNIYRYRSPYSFAERTKYIKEVVLADEAMIKFLSTYTPRVMGAKVYTALFKTGNAWLINCCYSVLCKGYAYVRPFMS